MGGTAFAFFHNLRHGGELDTWLENLLRICTNNGSHPKRFQLFRVSADKIRSGVLHALDEGVTREVCVAMPCGGAGMAGLGFQVEECQMRYNVDQAAASLQGAEETNFKYNHCH